MAANKLNILTNVPVMVEFTRDDVKWSNHPEYGQSYSHLVNAIPQGGAREDGMSLRATPLLQAKLVEAGCGKGAVAEITKKEVPQKGHTKTEWVVVIKRQPQVVGWTVKDWDGNTITPGDNPPAGPVGNPKLDPKIEQVAKAFDGVVEKGFGPKPTTSLKELKDLYMECVVEANLVMLALPAALVPPTEANALELTHLIKDLATSLFIEANKRGIKATPPESETFTEIPADNPADVLFEGEGGKADDNLPF